MRRKLRAASFPSYASICAPWESRIRNVAVVGSSARGRRLARGGFARTPGRNQRKSAQHGALPLHPRLAKLVLEAVERGMGDEGCAVAGLLSSGARADSCDLLRLLDSEWDQRTRQHIEQIRRVVKPPKQQKHSVDALPLSILAAFPDRVARRKKDNQLLLASGGSATLACESQADFLVAVDIEDRTEHALPLVRMYCAIQPGWLIDLFPDRVRERSGVEWNRTAERVDASSALLYEGLVIEETRSGAPDPEQAATLLAERAIELGVERFIDGDPSTNSWRESPSPPNIQRLYPRSTCNPLSPNYAVAARASRNSEALGRR